jgi:urea carboxylase
VCPSTIARGERWKMGQLKAGDRVRFVRVSESQAAALLRAQTAELEGSAVERAPARNSSAARDEANTGDAVLGGLDPTGDRPRVVYRRAGDDYLLVEYGPL